MFRILLFHNYQHSYQPSLSGFIARYGTLSRKKGEITPFFDFCLAQLYDVEIQDQANEDDIHQQPGKNNAVSKIFFA